MREADTTQEIYMSASSPGERSAPRDGDVIVARDSRAGVRHTVRQHPANAQFSASARDEALRLARAFAQTHAVDVWYSEDGTSRLLEVYRRVDS